MKLSKTQREVLQKMAEGWMLWYRTYDRCYLLLPGAGKSITVRFDTLRILRDAEYIETDSDAIRRRYTLTELGRSEVSPSGDARG